VGRGARVRLASAESPPCDLLITHVHGGLRAREKDLTGESKPVNKQQLEPGLLSDTAGGLRVVAERGQDALRLADSARRLDSSYQLFRGTTIILSRTDARQPYVEVGYEHY